MTSLSLYYDVTPNQGCHSLYILDIEGSGRCGLGVLQNQRLPGYEGYKSRGTRGIRAGVRGVLEPGYEGNRAGVRGVLEPGYEDNRAGVRG